MAIAASSLSVVSEVGVNNSEVDDALPEYLSDSDNSDVEMGVDDEFREEESAEEADDFFFCIEQNIFNHYRQHVEGLKNQILNKINQ